MSMPFLYLWDPARHGTPKSYEQAVDLWNTIHRQPEESVSEKIVAFGEEFGLFIDNSGEESWLNVLGGTGAYARGCRTAVLRLELPETDWQPVLVELVEIANKHGLVVLDEQGVTVFLPNGKVLPVGRAKGWNGLKAALREEGGFPQTLGQFKKWLTPQVEMMLARHGEWVKGFKDWGNRDPAYIRSDGNGAYIYISIGAWGSHSEFSVDLFFNVINPKISELCEKFKFIGPDVFFGGGLSYIHNNGSWRGKTVKGYGEGLALMEVIEAALFPALDDALSIQGLDNLLNGETDPRYREKFHNFVFKPQCLMVARLAGNPRFEELAKELAVETGWFGNEDVWKEEWPKLVKYLREEVQPVG